MSEFEKLLKDAMNKIEQAKAFLDRTKGQDVARCVALENVNSFIERVITLNTEKNNE